MKSIVTAGSQSSAKRGRMAKCILLAAVVALAVAGFVGYGDALSLERLASQESSLRRYQADHPVLVQGLAFAIYVMYTGLSLPGAAALTLLLGWFFSFWRGFVIAILASTTGATIAFLL